jgi:hypothetical protein
MVPTLILIYLLPAFVAMWRNHANVLAICALDILFGWTLLGYAIALIWALTGKHPREGSLCA